MGTRNWPVIIVFYLAMAYSIATGEVIYVDDDAYLGGNGQSWGIAYKNLQDALYKSPADGDQIWVAAETNKLARAMMSF